MINLEQIGAPAFMVRVDGPDSFRFIDANTALEWQSGLSRAAFDNSSPYDILPHDHAVRVCGRYAECATTGTSIEYESQLVRETTTYWRTTLTPLFEAATGRVERLLGISTNITTSHLAEQELQVANTRLALAMQVIKGAHWHLDVASQEFQPSPSLATLLGEDKPRMMSSEEWIERILPEDRDEATLHYLLDGTASHQVAQFRFVTPSGEIRWLRCRRMVLAGQDHRVTSIYGVTVDVTDEIRREQRLLVEADQDTLTPLSNRRAFLRHLEELIGVCEADAGMLSVVMLDLDGFKAVNDRHGHAAGDAVLIEVACRLKKAIRPYDACARLGGDEFIVSVRHLPLPALESLLLRIKDQIQAAPFSIGDQPIVIRTSLGHAGWRPGMTAADLVSRADDDLYEAKRLVKAQAARPRAA